MLAERAKLVFVDSIPEPKASGENALVTKATKHLVKLAIDVPYALAIACCSLPAAHSYTPRTGVQVSAID